MSEQSFWDDRARAVHVSQQCAEKKRQIEEWEVLSSDIQGLEELAREGGEAELSCDLASEGDALRTRYQNLERKTFLNGEHDASSAILAVHAGTGGVDAMDWAEMLLRMYLRFCERKDWKTREISFLRGNEAGIKSAIFHIEGAYAYGLLKGEHGVHRLVRISPFDAEQLRQTSFALVEVIPDLGELGEFEIKPEDMRIDVFRASGHGGQSVNTTDSAVRITHLPSGIVVSCQNERSQTQNKEMALRYLKAKLRHQAQIEREEEKKKLRGSYQEAAWSNQIRSYVLHPYTLVKDHRTNVETQDVHAVLDGDLMMFIDGALHTQTQKEKNGDGTK